MRQTRASSRRTKTTKTEPDDKTDVLLFAKRESSPVTKTEDVIEKQDSDFDDSKDEEDEFEEKQVVAPKKKRARASQPAKSAPRKKQVRGKQGRLEGLMKMPIDIFTEIALYLVPRDIITLARSNKFFRQLLMSKSAIHIWHGTMRNVPGLPPCPSDQSEPHYLALIYAPNCSMCGATVNRRMDEVLRVRLCPSCRAESLTNLHTARPEIYTLVLGSGKIMPSKRRWGYDLHAFKTDVAEAETQLTQREKAGDSDALEKWKEDRKKELDVRREQARTLGTFLDGLERDRGSELADLKKQRRLDIEKRLLEDGWKKEDLVFRYPRNREWSVLVEQPKVLTDRTWTNLQPKLIPLLEANREDRLEREKTLRKRERRIRLSEYLADIKEEMEPIIDVTIPRPINPGSTSSASSDETPSTVQLKHTGIFPKIADALEWDEMKGFYEDDLPVADMSERVDMCLAEIAGRANEWIDDVEGHLVGLLRRGREEDGLGRNIPDATLSVSGDSSIDPLENANSNEKILLRADSLFESTLSIGLPVALLVTYDTLVSNGYPKTSYHLYSLANGSEPPLNTTKFKRHSGAQKAARMLLEYLGKPNATFLEMKSVGQSYKCGRCDERGVRSWEEIVHHFALKQQAWDSVQKHQAELAKKGITYRNVHDPTFVTDKPMIKIMNKDEATNDTAGLTDIASATVCKVCSNSNILPEARAGKEGIIAHLADVHNIVEPKASEHYGPAFSYWLEDMYGPPDDYEDPIFWGQNHDWDSDSDDMYLDLW